MKSKKQARIWARLCALALIAVMLLTSAYAGSAVESGLAVDGLAAENLATENLAQQNTVPAEGTAATLAPASTNATEASTAVEDTTGSHMVTDTANGEAATIPYRAPQGGAAALAEDDPTYILVLGSDQINVTAFYPATTEANGNLPSSTNTQWGIIGLYYDMNHRAHILLAHNMNNVQSDKLGDFHLNSDTFQKGIYSYQLKLASLTKVVLKDEQGNQLESLTPKLSGKTPQGYFDIEVGDIEIGKNFTVSMDGNPGGWQIESIQVDLDLDYSLSKTVAKGTSAAEGVAFTESVSVERGDWVIYKITVENTGSVPLQHMVLKDLLPSGVFDESSVRVGVGEADDNIPNWQTFPAEGILFADYSSPGQFMRDVYITAQVKPDLDINTATTYTNTAAIEGMSMPTLKDDADIIVNPPTPGKLRVSKAVTSENPMDPAPDTAFNFTLTYAGTTKNFSLKNGESREFEIPATEFTVTETAVAGYTTKVNGVSEMTYTGTMTEGGSLVAAFENQFSARTISLNIQKVDANTKNPLADARFELVKADENWDPIDQENPVAIEATGEDGKATFNDIPFGNYLLYETKAPAGYKLPKDPVRVTVKAGMVTLTIDGQTIPIPTPSGEGETSADVTIPNKENDKLPVAGGAGTLWFTGGGLALAGAAALLYFKQRRKKGEE